MTAKTINALILSTDTRLDRILLNNDSEHEKFKINLESDIDNFQSIAKSDVYIFDVELTDNNLISTVSKIHELKKSIGKRPLILTGNKSVLKEVLNSGSIKQIVDRTINKPISYGQIRLAVNSSLLKATTAANTVAQKEPSNQRRYVVAMLLAAFAILSAVTFFKTKETPFDITNTSKNITPEQKRSLPDSVQPDQRAQQIDQLNQFAITALEEGRLSEPGNNNAIYFLTKLKNLDPYNNTANQTHQKLFQLLESLYIDHSQNGNDQDTKKALETILEYEPYNHKYAVLLRELQENIYLNRNNQTNDLDQSDTVSDVVTNAIEMPVAAIKNHTNAILNESQNLDPLVEKKTERLNNELTASVDTQPTPQPNFTNDADESLKNETIATPQKSETSPEEKIELDTNSLVASIDSNIDKPLEPKITKAEILKRSEPYYPKLAKEFNYEGWVELEYQVDTQGKATNIKVVDGKKIKTFEGAAVKALKKWVFSPSIDTVNNLPLMSEIMTTSFNFKLN